MTATENICNLKSLINYEVKERFMEIVEQMKAVAEGPMKGMGMPDIISSLRKQKDDIKNLMIETNKVFTGYKTEPYDFQVNDMKQLGRVEIKAVPYMLYQGRIRLKGNESPLRFELQQERLNVQFILCIDDSSFTKNPVTQLSAQQDRLMFSFPPTSEYCFIRVFYESQDLSPTSFVFRAYFGKPQSLLSGQILTSQLATHGTDEDPENMSAVNKTQSEKIKRLQLLARVQALIGDEVKGMRVIKQMEEIKTQKRDEMLRGRDFLMQNVEQACVWPEVALQNLQVRNAGKDLEIQMVKHRKKVLEEAYVKKAADYQHRWKVYRKQHEELIQWKQDKIEELARKAAFNAMFEMRRVFFGLRERFEENCHKRDLQLKKDRSQKIVRRVFFKYMCYKGMTQWRRNFKHIRNTLAYVYTGQHAVYEHKAAQKIIYFLSDKEEGNKIYEKMLKFYKIIQKIQTTWRNVCIMNNQRKQELKTAFQTEQDKLLAFIVKQGSSKDPKITVPSAILKNLRAMTDEKRDALLDRYFLKCCRAQSDRFFTWRERFKKLSMVQRIMIISTIQEEYVKNAEWMSNKVYAFKDVKVPPLLGLLPEQVTQFNRVINALYPHSQQQKQPPIVLVGTNRLINPFFLSSNDDHGPIMELLTNYQTIKYMPAPHLLSFMVLKASTLKQEDFDLVF
ncbi:hypothetical protein FGO68_gene14654 [Halteria grandinella]|uniref:Uncharacterized protein n=1 Tax=Halteria grandinella TaxID=5974 RepID=A0A8J8NZX2_HALGN|nr:hypothetical protein FGO68_gene14654 [Halteria grandinella]